MGKAKVSWHCYIALKPLHDECLVMYTMFKILALHICRLMFMWTFESTDKQPFFVVKLDECCILETVAFNS